MEITNQAVTRVPLNGEKSLPNIFHFNSLADIRVPFSLSSSSAVPGGPSLWFHAACIPDHGRDIRCKKEIISGEKSSCGSTLRPAHSPVPIIYPQLFFHRNFFPIYRVRPCIFSMPSGWNAKGRPRKADALVCATAEL